MRVSFSRNSFPANIPIPVPGNVERANQTPHSSSSSLVVVVVVVGEMGTVAVAVSKSLVAHVSSEHVSDIIAVCSMAEESQVPMTFSNTIIAKSVDGRSHESSKVMDEDRTC
jgi:hypothetical protein